MNEKILELIKGIGALTEIWVVAYTNFKAQGLNHKEALEHTREFVSLLINNSNANTDDT